VKLLLVTTHLDMGGISVYTVNLARYLQKKGIDVAVASSGGKLVERLHREGIDHYRLDIRTKSEFGIKALKAVPAAARLVKDERFQIVHAQTRVAQVVACLGGKISGTPLVTTCHGFFRHDRLGRRLLPCWGERTIAISGSVGEHLRKDFGLREERVKVIYNGIETDRYTPGRDLKDNGLIRRMGLSPDKTTVGTVGRLSPVKGQDHLIDAFGGALKKNGSLQLLIIGEGPEKESLLEKARRKGISGDVVIDAGLDEPLEKYLALMDIFCLPSLKEGLGLSLMEAMATGCACIASDTGGPAEIIEDGRTGLLVLPGDRRALAAAITRLAEDGGLRSGLAEAARGKALKEFSLEDNVDRTIEVYREVLDGS